MKETRSASVPGLALGDWNRKQDPLRYLGCSGSNESRDAFPCSLHNTSKLLYDVFKLQL